MSLGRRVGLFSVSICGLALAGDACAGVADDVRAQLRDKALAKADVGVEIVRLGNVAGDAKVIFRSESDVPLIPASNLKVVTTSAALDKLGGDFEFHTTLLKKGADLYLIGDGDPTLGDAKLLGRVNWKWDTVYKNWADELKRQGVASVGRVVVDDSVFDDKFVHPNWPIDQLLHWYEAGVGGLNFNVNCVDFYVGRTSAGEAVTFRTEPETNYVAVKNAAVTGGKNAISLVRPLRGNDVTLGGETNATAVQPASLSVYDPGLYTGTVLAEVLRREGITVSGDVARDRAARQTAAREGPGGGWSAVAALKTPIGVALDRANKDSINLYAEALCKRLGFAATGGQPGSWENGTAAVAAFLKRAGVDDAEYTLDDGCGLSKKNAISAHAMVQVLTYDYHSRNSHAFMTSLAVAGVDGTFEKRFTQGTLTKLQGRVFGKSGFVNGVSTFSGYLHGQDDAWYAYSILMNKVADVATAKVIQQKIIQAVDNAGGSAGPLKSE